MARSPQRRPGLRGSEDFSPLQGTHGVDSLGPGRLLQGAAGPLLPHGLLRGPPAPTPAPQTGTCPEDRGGWDTAKVSTDPGVAHMASPGQTSEWKGTIGMLGPEQERTAFGV